MQQRSGAGIKPAAASKLAPRFYGPFEVVQCIGDVAYKQQLPQKALIRGIFHVLLLKKFEGTLPEEVVPAPEKVICARLNRGVWEFLVQWVGCSAADASWEQLRDFNGAYPAVQLQDALLLGKEGNVVDSFVGHKCFRRRRRDQLAKEGNQRG